MRSNRGIGCTAADPILGDDDVYQHGKGSHFMFVEKFLAQELAVADLFFFCTVNGKFRRGILSCSGPVFFIHELATFQYGACTYCT